MDFSRPKPSQFLPFGALHGGHSQPPRQEVHGKLRAYSFDKTHRRGWDDEAIEVDDENQSLCAAGHRGSCLIHEATEGEARQAISHREHRGLALIAGTRPRHFIGLIASFSVPFSTSFGLGPFFHSKSLTSGPVEEESNQASRKTPGPIPQQASTDAIGATPHHGELAQLPLWPLGRAWRTWGSSRFILPAALSYSGARRGHCVVFRRCHEPRSGDSVGNQKFFLLFSGPVGDNHRWMR